MHTKCETKEWTHAKANFCYKWIFGPSQTNEPYTSNKWFSVTFGFRLNKQHITKNKDSELKS